MPILLACKFLFLSNIKIIGSRWQNRFILSRPIAHAVYIKNTTTTTTTEHKNNDDEHNLINLWSAENIIWQRNYRIISLSESPTLCAHNFECEFQFHLFLTIWIGEWGESFSVANKNNQLWVGVEQSCHQSNINKYANWWRTKKKLSRRVWKAKSILEMLKYRYEVFFVGN